MIKYNTVTIILIDSIDVKLNKYTLPLWVDYWQQYDNKNTMMNTIINTFYHFGWIIGSIYDNNNTMINDTINTFYHFGWLGVQLSRWLDVYPSRVHF